MGNPFLSQLMPDSVGGKDWKEARWVCSVIFRGTFPAEAKKKTIKHRSYHHLIITYHLIAEGSKGGHEMLRVTA